MDFGDILDAWERQTAIPQGDKKRRKLSKLHENLGNKEKNSEKSIEKIEKKEKNALAEWLKTHEIYDKDAENFLPEAKISGSEKRKRLLRKKPDAEIDLHGLTQDEAWGALEDFFQECRNKKFEKALIIHGKGSHAGSAGVLKQLTRNFIEYCPFAGESGQSEASDGGSGATWVVFKY